MAINPVFYTKKFLRLLLTKPERILPHIKSRSAYYLSGLLKGYAGFPHTIYLGISNKCNLECKMCDLGQKSDSLYRQHLSPAKELSLSEWKEFIDQVAFFKPDIEFSAAEPLLYKDLFDLIKYIKEVKGLKCRIFTNGFLLEEYSKLIIESSIDHMIVSIDGPADTHDYIRGKPGLFDKVMLGLLELKGGTRDKGPFIDINYTISHHNYGKIIDTFNVLNNRGVRFDRFTIIQTLSIPKEAAKKHNEDYPDLPVTALCETGVEFSSIDVNVLRKQIDSLIHDKSGKVRVYPDVSLEQLDKWYNSPLETVGNTPGCRFIWSSANITSDGEVIPYMRCVDKSFGNITRSGFKEIWNGKDFRRFRLLSKKVKSFPVCLRCSASFMK